MPSKKTQLDKIKSERKRIFDTTPLKRQAVRKEIDKKVDVKKVKKNKLTDKQILSLLNSSELSKIQDPKLSEVEKKEIIQKAIDDYFAKEMSKQSAEISKKIKMTKGNKKSLRNVTGGEVNNKLISDVIDKVEDKVEISKTDIKKVDKKFDKKTEKDLKRGKLEYGKLITYEYTAKWGHKLPKWDKQPITIPLHFYTKKSVNYMLGVNLHYLDKQHRSKLWHYIVSHYLIKLDNNKKGAVSSERKLGLLYMDIKKDSKLLPLFKKCIKLYIVSRIKSSSIKPIPLKYYDKLFGKESMILVKANWFYNDESLKPKDYHKKKK